MTKGKALYNFFSSFGIYAAPDTAVEEEAVYPRITYNYVTSAWESGEVAITVNIWYRTESEAEPNAKAQELSDALGIGGKVLECDGGYIWLKRGSPWCQSMQDTDNLIKRRYINISAEYLTEN